MNMAQELRQITDAAVENSQKAKIGPTLAKLQKDMKTVAAQGRAYISWQPDDDNRSFVLEWLTENGFKYRETLYGAVMISW